MKRYTVAAEIVVRVELEVAATSPIDAIVKASMRDFVARARLGFSDDAIRKCEFVSARKVEGK